MMQLAWNTFSFAFVYLKIIQVAVFSFQTQIEKINK